MVTNIVKKYREKRGYTPEGLAKAVGVKTGLITEWERDIKIPDRKMMTRISQVLNCPLCDLVTYFEGE